MLYNLWDKVKVCINEPNYWLRKTLDDNPNHEVAALFWTKSSVEEWWTDDEILTDKEWLNIVSLFDNVDHNYTSEILEDIVRDVLKEREEKDEV